MIGFVISLFVVGVIAGYAARLIVPGEENMSFVLTLALGIVGSFVGGFIGWAIFGGGDVFRPGGVVLSIIGAALSLFGYNALGGNKTSSPPHASPS